ncbi:MAG: DUF3426 domain-containing protein [Reinekea sp.]
MADDSLITQCPHCNTSFRVRKSQLSVANGSVRCGACLQVFSARNHIVASPQAIRQPVTENKPQPKSPPIKTPVKARESIKTQAVPEPTFNKPKLKPPSPRTPPEEEFLFDDDDDAEFLFVDGDDDDEFIFKDGPEDSLFDERDNGNGFGELSDTFLNLTNSSRENQSTSHFHKEALEMESDELDDDDDQDESWAESMLEEIEKEEKISLSKPAVFESREVGSSKSKASEKAQTYRAIPSTVPDFTQPAAVMKPSVSQVVSNASKSIELDFSEIERLQRLRPLGWLIVVLLCVLLAAQFAWYMRDTYARMDQYRGLYQQACNLFNCTLPDQIDLSAIRTSVLVREHKDPRILEYTDVNNKLVADQEFTPDQYLKGELTGETLMPINTRIYISFPIKKTAQNALNYQLSLH